LDESGYTAMWQADKSPDAPGRLENLKELVRALADFETLQGFLDHVSLVMEIDDTSDAAKLSMMTLHGAKGLEFDTVFLPGWEEGVFPNQRSLDEGGLKRGLPGRASGRSSAMPPTGGFTRIGSPAFPAGLSRSCRVRW
jgi:DNA helicase-2/ATP-dependent DNA helicase PcrA